MVITSTSNKNICQVNSLKEKKYRDSLGKFLIEGEHLIEMASNIDTIYTTDESYTNDKYPVCYVNDQVMKKISFVEAPQGIVAVCNKPNYKIDYNLKRYLLCDNVSDPGNMGTIIRTALAFKVDMVILEKGSVDIFNDKVIRGSQGAIFKIPVVYENLEEVIKKLQDMKVEVFASTLSKRSINLKEVKKVDKFALIVGNEGSGVKEKYQEMSDYNIKIEHSDTIDSLNVGVATSIMLYYLDNIGGSK